MKKRTHLLLSGIAFIVAAAVAQAAPAAENWENHCQKCHGADGKATTKMGKKLKVRDYTDPAVQAQMTEESMYDAIANGVKNDAGKETMKGYKDELSEPEMKDLVAYIRQMKA